MPPKPAEGELFAAGAKSQVVAGAAPPPEPAQEVPVAAAAKSKVATQEQEVTVAALPPEPAQEVLVAAGAKSTVVTEEQEAVKFDSGAKDKDGRSTQRVQTGGNYLGRTMDLGPGAESDEEEVVTFAAGSKDKDASWQSLESLAAKQPSVLDEDRAGMTYAARVSDEDAWMPSRVETRGSYLGRTLEEDEGVTRAAGAKEEAATEPKAEKLVRSGTFQGFDDFVPDGGDEEDEVAQPADQDRRVSIDDGAKSKDGSFLQRQKT